MENLDVKDRREDIEELGDKVENETKKHSEILSTKIIVAFIGAVGLAGIIKLIAVRRKNREIKEEEEELEE